MRKTLLLVVALAIAPVDGAVAQSPDGAGVLKPGDAVQVTVWRRPELSGEFAIAADGTIAHPLFREVRVTGISLADVELQLKQYLGQLEANPQFVIQPLLRVAVGGEVRQPSLYRLPPSTTIAEAVATAGGATDRAKLERVRLFRGGAEIVVDLTRPEAGRAQEPILSGDQLFVDRRINYFRDYVAPAGSITAAVAALINIVLRF